MCFVVYLMNLSSYLRFFYDCEKRMMTFRIILHAVNIKGFIYINFTASCNIVIQMYVGESSPYNLKSNNLIF